MPASLGGTAFITLKGHRDPPDAQIEDISRTGVNGTEKRFLQKRGKEFEMVGHVDVTDLAAGRALFLTLHALRGTVVSVTDDFGDSFTADLIDVDRQSLRATPVAAGGVSGNPGALLVVRFRLQQT